VASSVPGGGPQGGEILKSNVDVLKPEPPGRPARSVLPLVLAGLLLFVLGAGAALFWASTQRAPQPTSAASARATITPVPVAAASTRAGSGSTGAGAPLPDINGISCDALESTIVHVHVHLAIFVNGGEQQVPLGIGIGQPWQVSDSAEGPFVTDGPCFYWIHTHTQDGIVHIESPVRRRFTLGDFFAIWQVPLGANQVGGAQGPVISYVNGQRSTTEPPAIPLLPHERIQLDIGGDVPAYQFNFPDGD